MATGNLQNKNIYCIYLEYIKLPCGNLCYRYITGWRLSKNVLKFIFLKNKKVLKSSFSFKNMFQAPKYPLKLRSTPKFTKSKSLFCVLNKNVVFSLIKPKNLFLLYQQINFLMQDKLKWYFSENICFLNLKVL